MGFLGIFQNEVRIMLNGKSSLSLFHVVLRYMNPGTTVSGRITIYPSWAKAGESKFFVALDEVILL